jgi:Tol biopolymer transport system component/DNA-binding winged helix-turn-helix (wHTH) protein
MKVTSTRFRLNEVVVDPDAGTIGSGSDVKRIPLRLMKLLCHLADANGSTVDRDELIDFLWPRGHVNEEALSRAVAELRQHLGDNARNPKFIETIPKRGYRLIVQITAAAPGMPQLDKKTAANIFSKPVVRWVSAVVVLLFLLLGIFNVQKSSNGNITQALLASANRLTADSGMKHQPELSPDGQWLVYVRFKQGKGVLNLISTASANQNSEIIRAPSMSSPVFNPSGSKIAVATSQDQVCMVQQFSVNGGELDPLTSCRIPSESPILDWSSDGKMLAFVDTEAATGSTAIWIMSLLDGSRQRLTTPPDAYSFDTRPRISPDGSTLSFTRGTRAAREIWLVDLKKISADNPLPPDARQLTFDGQYMTSHDWMPDGKALILDSERSGHRALWKLDLDGNWTLLGARDAESPSMAGNKLSFKIAQYESNIWVLNARNGELAEQPLIASTKYDSHPVWSPDGTELAFSSNRTDRGSIWLANADGSGQRLVYEPPEGRVIWPMWSPDGKYLVATLYSSRGQSLVKIALDHHEVSIVPTSGVRPYGGSYSADGKWLYYIAGSDERGTRLWRQATEGVVEASVLIDQTVNHYRIVQNQWVVYTKHSSEGLYKASLEDPSKEYVVLPELPQAAWDDWTTSDGWVYFPQASQTDGMVLMKMELNGGPAEKVSNHVPSSFGPNLEVREGRDDILMSRTDRAYSDLFLVELQD